MPSPSPPRRRAAPSATDAREAPTPSQLDLLAERNERFATPSPFARAVPAIAVGAVALLGALFWWFAPRSDADAPWTATNANAASAAAAAVVPVAAASGPDGPTTGASTSAASNALPTAVPALAVAASPSAVSGPAQTEAQAATFSTASTPAPTSAERARRVQVRRDAEARAKTTSAPAPRQQRDTDKAPDPTKATVAAADRGSGSGPAAEGAETGLRPRTDAAAAGVRGFCAGRNIVSELVCHTRECRKPERATDATCLRLKEIEEAQRRVDPQ